MWLFCDFCFLELLVLQVVLFEQFEFEALRRWPRTCLDARLELLVVQVVLFSVLLRASSFTTNCQFYFRESNTYRESSRFCVWGISSFAYLMAFEEASCHSPKMIRRSIVYFSPIGLHPRCLRALGEAAGASVPEPLPDLVGPPLISSFFIPSDCIRRGGFMVFRVF